VRPIQGTSAQRVPSNILDMAQAIMLSLDSLEHRVEPALTLGHPPRLPRVDDPARVRLRAHFNVHLAGTRRCPIVGSIASSQNVSYFRE
jgi:hypothetical protein